MASNPPPTPRSGTPRPTVTPVARATQGRYATQGMISPTDPPFVDPTTGVLTPVSFRFLYGLFNRVNALEQALVNAGIPIPP